MDDYAHAPVTDNPIVVDFSGCKYLDDLHERIRKSFGFPVCCGKTGMQFGIVSMDTLMRMRAGQYR